MKNALATAPAANPVPTVPKVTAAHVANLALRVSVVPAVSAALKVNVAHVLTALIVTALPVDTVAVMVEAGTAAAPVAQ